VCREGPAQTRLLLAECIYPGCSVPGCEVAWNSVACLLLRMLSASSLQAWAIPVQKEAGPIITLASGWGAVPNHRVSSWSWPQLLHSSQPTGLRKPNCTCGLPPKPLGAGCLCS
jgi:hypothetical protein